METRSRHPSHVSRHPSASVHGQDLSQLCQPLRIPGGPGAQGKPVQLPLCKSVSSSNTPIRAVCRYHLADTNTTVVYAGYFFGQYPCGWLIGRFPAQKVMAISVFFWGLMVILMTQSRDYSSALGVRFIMGIFEAAVTPGLTLMTGFWYTRREIPLRQCIWYSSLGWGGIVSCIQPWHRQSSDTDICSSGWLIYFYGRF